MSKWYTYMPIFVMFCGYCYIFPNLVYCIEKDLATLTETSAKKLFSYALALAAWSMYLVVSACRAWSLWVMSSNAFVGFLN
jgi:hypothetical protein